MAKAEDSIELAKALAKTLGTDVNNLVPTLEKLNKEVEELGKEKDRLKNESEASKRD